MVSALSNNEGVAEDADTQERREGSDDYGHGGHD